MKITLRGKNIEITEAIEEKVSEKLSKLDKYFIVSENVEAKVLVRTYPYGQKIEVTIPTEYVLLRAEVVDQDLYNAIDLVIDKLEGQIRKYKTRLNRKSKDNKLAFNLASIEPLEEEEDVYIELGLQTIHEQTSKLINRGHTFQEFLDGLALCRKYNLEVCVHIINGLPFETKEMMIETAKTLGQLDIQALKIHMLFVVKNTKLQQMYENHEFNMLSRQEYIDIVVEQLRYIKPEIVIERLTGDGKIDDLIAPLWHVILLKMLLRPICVMNLKSNYLMQLV